MIGFETRYVPSGIYSVLFGFSSITRWSASDTSLLPSFGSQSVTIISFFEGADIFCSVLSIIFLWVFGGYDAIGKVKLTNTGGSLIFAKFGVFFIIPGVIHRVILPLITDDTVVSYAFFFRIFGQ